MQNKLWKRMMVASVFLWCAGLVTLSEHWWGHAPFWVAELFFGLAFFDCLWGLLTYNYHDDWE